MASEKTGEKGSMQGQIKTPMCSENVMNKGGEGKVEKFPGTMGDLNKSGAKGGGNSIAGPGAKGKWDTQIKISGSNLKY